MAALGSSRVAVVGGGIVGLATAHHLVRRFPGCRVTVFEKETTLAAHQSGRNSGVLHSGVYYRPGSSKARICRAGNAAMRAFCDAQGVAWERCGKVIVATNAGQLQALAALEERAIANGVRCTRIDPDGLRELEPHAAGVAALHVPDTGIVDFPAVCARLAAGSEEAGARVLCGAEVLRIEARGHEVIVQTSGGGAQAADWAINCAGLQSDRVARRAGLRPRARIVPFRGEYYTLRPEARGLCRNLIYPVPDPSLPFLGVHLSRRIDGRVDCGPNAVLAFAREGYRKTQISLRDLMGMAAFGGSWRLFSRHWRTGAAELRRSWSTRAFGDAVRELVPELRDADLEPAPAGIRAQAVGPEGSLVDDFLFEDSERMVHVINAPSPGATASLAIGEAIVDRLVARAG